MRDINEYIDKINKIAKKEENVKFLPITSSQLPDNVDQIHSDLEDYKEIKEKVKDIEAGLSVSGKKVVPVVVPIKDRRPKR